MEKVNLSGIDHQPKKRAGVSFWNRLNTKLVLLFLALSLLPLTIFGMLAFVNVKQAIEEDTVNHLSSVALLRENAFERWLENNQRVLRKLARHPQLQQLSGELSSIDRVSSVDQAGFLDILTDHSLLGAEAESDFNELFLLDPIEGRIVASTDERQMGKFRTTEPFFLNGRTRTYVQDVYYSLSLEQPAVTIGTPVTDQAGNLQAVLAGHLDLTELSQIMQYGSDPSETEETYLVSKSNFFVTEGRLAPGYALEETVYTEGVENCLNGHDGFGQYPDYRGVSVIGVYRWLPEHDLCIVTETDQSEVYAPINRLRDGILQMIGVIALIVTGFALVFARTITQPLRHLAAGVQEFGRGNLDYRAKISAKDEVGQLAWAFNAMAANQQQVIETLKFQANALAQVHDAVVAIDNDDKIIYINEAAAKQYELQPEEVIGRPLREAY